MWVTVSSQVRASLIVDAAPPGCVLANDRGQVADRCSALSELFDDATFAHLDRLGVAWCGAAWTSGAGRGRLTQWLADNVGTDG